MPIHNKLVRDRIPEIIERSGKTPHCRPLSHDEYLTELDRKLDEECAEYQADKSLEELADMLEVIYAIAEARGYSLEELEQMLRHTKTFGIIEIEPTVWKRLTAEIRDICEKSWKTILFG